MLSYKKPEAEVRLRYPRYVEIGAIAALLIVVGVFLFSKKIEREIKVRTAEDVVLETEEIPITRQVKRAATPARPTIPVEDPEVDVEADLAFDDIDEIDWSMEAPPPPPSVEEEIVEFFLVENPPQIQGGTQALYDYMRKNDLYPEMARKAQIEGVVIINFVVNTEGKPVDVTIGQERPQGLGFGEAGMKAISAMTFSPGMQRDKPVSVRMQQPIRFQLK